jgi:hypothetical protein
MDECITIKHLRARQRSKDKPIVWSWEPAPSLRKYGFKPIALGTDQARAEADARKYNAQAEAARIAGGEGPMTPYNSVKKIIAHYEASPRYTDLKPRTKKDYGFALKIVIGTWGDDSIEDLSTEAIEVLLAEIRQTSIFNQAKVGQTLRVFLDFAYAYKHMVQLPPKFRLKTPKRRRVMWQPQQIVDCAAKLADMGWQSLSVGFLLSWCLAQNPCDIWTLKRSHYVEHPDHDGVLKRCIDLTRVKTEEGGEPIPVFDDIADALDAYLIANPCGPNEPLFRHEKIGGAWHDQTRSRKFQEARHDLGLPKKLKMVDLRRTGITEALKAGFQLSQVRALSRHASVAGLAPYDVVGGTNTVIDIQAVRKKKRIERVLRPTAYGKSA